MELNRLEKYKEQYKELASKINSLQLYLNDTNKVKGISLITPYQVAVQTGVDELAALFILSLAEKENLVTKKYSVFSDADNLIGEFQDQQSIPETITDPETGKEIDRDHFYVQLSFEVEK